MPKVGRPSKYNDNVVEQSKYYLDNHTDYDDIIPSIVGLAYLLKVTRQTIYTWGEEHPEFLDILESLNQKQERLLLSGGLGGSFNPSITKLVLGKHNYHEKQETEHSGSINFSNLSDQELEDIANGD